MFRTHQMIAFMTAGLITFASFAADKGDDESWKVHVRNKELQRAREGMQAGSNTQRFEGKYGWLKESYPTEFNALINASQQAGAAWARVVQQIEGGADLNNLDAIKEPAYSASAQSWVAEQTIRYLSAVASMKHMTQKVNSPALTQKVNNATAMYQELITLKKQESQIQARIRRLEVETRAMGKEINVEFESARRAEKERQFNQPKKK